MPLSSADSKSFEYVQAFDRNLGWLSSQEQGLLRESCVAIAGLGGTGGFQAQALARLGVGKFKIADPDYFEWSNFNRQLGATCDTVGQSKASTIQRMILSINPEAQIEVIHEGIHERNAESFLSGVDLVIDGIDFFALDHKLYLFEQAYRRKVTALTVAPIGFGASLIVFSPQGMSYKDYFDLRDGMSEDDKRFSVMFGLSPNPLCFRYLKGDVVNPVTKRASSVVPALMMTGAVTGAEAVKILTGKFPPSYCPNVFQLDLMTQTISKKYYRNGMKGPVMKIKKAIAKVFFDKKSKKS